MDTIPLNQQDLSLKCSAWKGSIPCLWSHKILALKYVLVLKHFRCEKNLGSEKIVGSKKLRAQRNFLKRFGPKEFLVQNYLGYKKFGPKYLGPQKLRHPRNWTQKVWSKLGQ